MKSVMKTLLGAALLAAPLSTTAFAQDEVTTITVAPEEATDSVVVGVATVPPVEVLATPVAPKKNWKRTLAKVAAATVVLYVAWNGVSYAVGNKLGLVEASDYNVKEAKGLSKVTTLAKKLGAKSLRKSMVLAGRADSYEHADKVGFLRSLVSTTYSDATAPLRGVRRLGTAAYSRLPSRPSFLRRRPAAADRRPAAADRRPAAADRRPAFQEAGSQDDSAPAGLSHQS